MSKKTTLPKTLYARMERDGDTEYPLAWEESIDAIEGDGPTVVGVYQLVGVNTYRKTVEVVK